MEWSFKAFKELDNRELYGLLQLRNAVFVLEQNCPYQDADEKDFVAIHVLGFTSEQNLGAYCRILPIGSAYSHSASIGRVVTASQCRGTGVGKVLMGKAIAYACENLGYKEITISAQSHLQRFYEGFGFKRTPKKEYLEDNIPHREMVLKL
jgi:ElaA protein